MPAEDLRKIAQLIWKAEHISTIDAGQSLQRTVQRFANSSETRAALRDLAESGTFNARQLVQIRWLVIQCMRAREFHRAQIDAAIAAQAEARRRSRPNP